MSGEPVKGGVVFDNYKSQAQQTADNTRIIIALMRRLGITEADLKASELPQPGQPACGLSIIDEPDGGLVVSVLEPEVATALMEAQEHRQQ